MKWEGFLYSYCLAIIKTSPGFEIIREEKYGGNVKFMNFRIWKMHLPAGLEECYSY